MYVKIILSFLLLYSCGGIETSSNSPSSQDSSYRNNSTDDTECLQWLSAADINRQNGSYQDCVDAYNISLEEATRLIEEKKQNPPKKRRTKKRKK